MQVHIKAELGWSVIVTPMIPLALLNVCIFFAMWNDVNMRLSGNSCLYVYIQQRTELMEQTQIKAHFKNCMQVCTYVKNIIMHAGHF